MFVARESSPELVVDAMTVQLLMMDIHSIRVVWSCTRGRVLAALMPLAARQSTRERLCGATVPVRAPIIVMNVAPNKIRYAERPVKSQTHNFCIKLAVLSY